MEKEEEVKNKQSSPLKSEPGLAGFTPKVKPKEKGVAGIIEGIDSDVKHPLESVMTLLFKAMSEIDKLRRKAREVE